MEKGTLPGQRPTAVARGSHSRFAWVGFRPDTELWTP